MKKPGQKRMRRHASRKVRQVLVISTGLLAAPNMEPAQAQGCNPAAAGDCTIPSGFYSQPFQGQAFSSSPVNLTNNGTFSVAPSQYATFLGALQSIANGSPGSNSTDNDAPGGYPSGNLVLQNNGAVTLTNLVFLEGTSAANAVYGAAIGGNGGNYTNTNAKHDGGAAANSGTATLNNIATITVNQEGSGPTSTLVSGAALLVDSIGGAGGNVTSMGPDQNGNPTYHNQNGRAGASGNVATLTNSGTINVSFNQPVIGTGYWGAGARSLGGAGGTGNDGQPGGASLAASATNTGNINVAFVWGAPVAFTPATPTATPGGFALHARSQGGAGNMSVNSGNDGGSGGNANTAAVTVGGLGQPLTVTLSTSAVSGLTTIPLSAAVASISLGGVGGAGYDSSTGGLGGSATTASVTVLDAVTIQANGAQTIGVLALAQGGAGGSSGVGQNNSKAGDGGSTGYYNTSTNAAQITITNAAISTTGSDAPAVAVISRGGAGGTGLKYEQALEPAARGGVGGGGGNNSPIRIDATGARITTSGQQAVGVLALAQGGAGGNGGDVAAGEGQSGPGGSGGQAAPVTVNINAGTVITTTGGPASSTASTTTTPPAIPGAAAAFGILASSIGGAGGMGGAVNVDAGAGTGNGGPGGGAYNVTVNLASGSSVTTSGASASGVAARSVGGAGGPGSVTSSSGGIVSSPPDGGPGGNSGNVTITSGAQVTTRGDYAHGLVAQSITGAGGDGGNGAGFIYAPSGSGGASGLTGTATITNTGVINTSGVSALGIQAQSIGGASGSAGSVDGSVFTVGGSSAAAANGSLATVTHSGSIATQGQGSIGILAQSIGGGGGNGGDAKGVLGSVGGTGTGGGNADTTTVNMSGSITTQGQLAHGIVAQSIGGGGGNGGNASTQGAVVTVAIGGSAGAGGNGGATNLSTTGGNIALSGSNAIGMVAQSIGGGGGTGGSGYAQSGSLAFAVAHAVGGSGGSGGTGGAVTLDLSGISIATGQATRASTNQNPVDAHGIVAQSIGGGGGIGGSAAAQAVAVGVIIPGSDGNTVAVSIAESVGGSGGTAGAGGAVSFTTNGSSATINSITTQGQGSHGVLLQSIGGGGGAGGDSSAMAATFSYGRVLTAAGSYPPPGDAEAANGPNSISLTAAVTLGGSGQSGGSGGAVTATLNGATILTVGDYANGLVMQSIGGGGGNGGVGSSTTAALGSTRSVNLAIGVGGTGGTGGIGNTVTGTVGAQSIVQTYGASALGVVAQSIGGGGGTSQGSTVNLGGSYTIGNGTTFSPAASLNISVGARGGGGGNGGQVRMTVDGQVLTSGSDAPGVVLQSLGGGGGIGGSAGSEASSDNPISLGTKLRELASDIVERNVPGGLGANLSVGGRGGVAGAGFTVNYTQSGSITTQGDWSHGLVAQSIGGGGGMGGVAASGSSAFGLQGNVAVGGVGGGGGAGDSVNLTFNPGSSISTGATTAAGTRTGYAAFGVLAQSIGGGGGTGVDGSTSSLLNFNLGGAGSGSGGTGGNGSQIYVTGTTTISTQGDVGVGMVLQSIGGGGGMTGAGSSLSLGAGRFTGTTSLNVGGSSGAAGSGGRVQLDTFTPNIQTLGANAYGILAQSIGGGGGFGFTPSLSSTVTNTVGGTSMPASAAEGGPVTLNLVGGLIQTAGMGAHGIVAQSIGGGGGISGLPTGPATMSTSSGSFVGTTTNTNTQGVSITSSTAITTTGDFAYGILAQSIGGGGGIYVQNGTQVTAGTQSTSANVLGGINITQTAPILATGANSVGIFAQAVGSVNPAVTHVYVSAAIQGGTGEKGYGIWVDGLGPTNLIWVQPGGSVSAGSGNAILMQQGSVNNQGQITGSYSVGGNVTNAGTINAGPSLNAELLVNSGTVEVAALVRHGITRVSGDFTQRASGRLVIDADFAGRRSDVMEVQGAADLAGRVRPRLTSVLPNVELPFLTVSGPVTGTVQGEQTTIFGYNVNRKRGDFTVSANADFTPAGYGLSRNAAAVAGHLQAAWDAGGTGLGPLFALLGNTADAGGEGAYAAALRQVSPNGSLAPGARVAASARAFANAAMSCPQFEGTTAMLTEGECVWAGLTGRTAAQASADGLGSFRLNSTTWQAGGQRALGGGWFLGGSIAYENSRLSTTEGLNSGRGQAGYAAVTMKYQTGPWLVAGAVFGGGGEFNNTRTITLPGFGAIARGSPTLLNAGAMLRATYTLGREEFYLRPSLSLSLVHARSSAFRESGAGVLNLDVASASSTVAALTPALEVGGRVALSNGMVMRLFTSAGVSLLSDGRWSQESRLAIAPAAGRFSSVVRTDQVVGRVTAGAQIFATDRLELRLQYEGEYSAHLTGHGGSLAVAMRF
ncbi:MAG: autotransporter outer membrane beta-barrel domain-containing protein [Roseococcus sp.]|nr:autotransporter outer membrane beta-barrel domain-containing protein [Roseococcus sp.]